MSDKKGLLKAFTIFKLPASPPIASKDQGSVVPHLDQLRENGRMAELSKRATGSQDSILIVTSPEGRDQAHLIAFRNINSLAGPTAFIMLDELKLKPNPSRSEVESAVDALFRIQFGNAKHLMVVTNGPMCHISALLFSKLAGKPLTSEDFNKEKGKAVSVTLKTGDYAFSY